MTCVVCGKQYLEPDHVCGDNRELDELRRKVDTLATSLVVSVAVLFFLVARLYWR